MPGTTDENIVDTQQVIDDINLNLRFEVGATRMAVGQLASLQPGYVFELQTPVENPVTILANGRPIGRGRLVQIDDRVGVQFMKEQDHE